jgi:hypothetical protein
MSKHKHRWGELLFDGIFGYYSACQCHGCRVVRTGQSEPYLYQVRMEIFAQSPKELARRVVEVDTENARISRAHHKTWTKSRSHLS